MKKHEYKQIADFKNRNNLLMFIETMEEVLFPYSFESYKLPALNLHYLCLEIIQAQISIASKFIKEGNFTPLAEEFEEMLSKDSIIRRFLHTTDYVLEKRDKNKQIINFKTMELKGKIKNYTDIASYICEFCETNASYFSNLIEMLEKAIYESECTYENLRNIYLLTRELAIELVNGGYSPEYVNQELTVTFLDENNYVFDDRQEFQNFISKFSFEEKSFKILFGVSEKTAHIVDSINNAKIIDPNIKEIKFFNLRHKRDKVIEIESKGLDKYKATQAALNCIHDWTGIHRISQHNQLAVIKPTALVKEIDDENKVTAEESVKTLDNIMLRAKNEKQIQAYFFDNILIHDEDLPSSFYRAVSLHNSALDSKNASEQLLDLWTALEILMEYDITSNNDDKINVICDILTNILNRSYLFNQISQLYKDLETVLEDDINRILDNIPGNEQYVLKLSKLLSIKEYNNQYMELLSLLNDCPLLRYRIEYFTKEIFCNSEGVYEELLRHKRKVKWQIMRIYRNRNMIAHNGWHMPYLNVILGNLHYYFDSVIDVLTEYYIKGIKNNHIIFMDIEKQELSYLEMLGMNKKGKIDSVKTITEENYKNIIFNGYEGNEIKNMLKKLSKKANSNQ